MTIIGDRVKGLGLSYLTNIPTVNVIAKENIKNGVYLVKVDSYFGICFVNKKIEIYFIDFNGCFTSKNQISIKVIKKIREIIGFDSVKLLKEQLKKDVIIAKGYINDKCCS